MPSPNEGSGSAKLVGVSILRAGRGARFNLRVDERDCEEGALFVAVKASIPTGCMSVAHLLCSRPRGPGFWRCLVIQYHNRVMNDFNVRVRINKVNDHWIFSRLPPHA